MRNRLLALLLLPVATFLWLIGWSLYYISSRKVERKQRSEQAASKQDSLEVIAIIDEEKFETVEN